MFESDIHLPHRKHNCYFISEPNQIISTKIRETDHVGVHEVTS
jgi:hypothetical protein